MTKRILIQVSFCALLVSACSTAPETSNSTLPKAASYTAKDGLVTKDQRIMMGKQITSDWWTLFASEPLNNLIRNTIENNYDLAAARETLEQAQEEVKAKSGSMLPQASLGALAGRQKYGVALFGPSNITIPPFTYYEVGPSISWMPDLFGGQRHALAQQQALAAYQSHQLDAAYLTLTGSTVAASLEMASVTEEIHAARRIIAEDEKILQLVKEAYAIGSASRLEILSAQKQLLDDHALLPPLEQRLSVSRHALSILAGKAPANWNPPSMTLQEFSLPRELPLSLPSELIKRRPDILAAEDNLHSASAAIGIASANLYPSITLTANMMQEALTPAGIFKSAATAWSLAAGLSVPIFSSGTLSAEKRAAEHAYQAALDQYRQIILNAFGDVADDLTALDDDSESTKFIRNAVETASSTANLALESYREGAIGLLQVQDAQRILAQTQLDLIRSQHQRYLDCARLFVALGGSPMGRKE